MFPPLIQDFSPTCYLFGDQVKARRGNFHCYRRSTNAKELKWIDSHFFLSSLSDQIKNTITDCWNKIFKIHALLILAENGIIHTQLGGVYGAFGNWWHGQRSVIRVLQVRNGSQNLSLFTRKAPVRHVSSFIKKHLNCTYWWIKAQPCCFAGLWDLWLKIWGYGIGSMQICYYHIICPN